jgi:shikimate kinase
MSRTNRPRRQQLADAPIPRTSSLNIPCRTSNTRFRAGPVSGSWARDAVNADANIVLVGFMGTGKTTVGRVLAGRTGRPLLDMDAEIEARAGKAVSDIFRDDGEPAFRRMERDLVRDLAARSGLLISSGGGIVLDPLNIADFSRTGLVACLLADAETILRRVESETHRPLIQVADRRARVTELLDRRRPLYEAIPFRIDTSHLEPAAIADRILTEFRRVTA